MLGCALEKIEYAFLPNGISIHQYIVKDEQLPVVLADGSRHCEA